MKKNVPICSEGASTLLTQKTVQFVFLHPKLQSLKKFFALVLIFVLSGLHTSKAQPSRMEGAWKTGFYVNNLGTMSVRRGNTLMYRDQTNSGVGTNIQKALLFNNATFNYNPKWTASNGTLFTKNVKITNGAILNGGSDIQFAVTQLNYYTFVIGNNIAASNNIAILETTFNPTTFAALPTQSPVAASVNAGNNVVVTVTLSANPQSGERVFVRYSSDNFAANFNVVEATGFSGGIGTATIPGAFNTAGVTVSYYVFTTTIAAPAAADADYLALRIQTQSGETGSIWSYTVAAVAPTAQPTNIQFASVTAGSMIVNWTAASPAPTGYIVLRTSGATPPNTDPSNGTFYSIGNTIGNATVAYQGTALTTSALSNLIDNTQYNLKIYSYNGSGAGTLYFMTSPLSGSQSTTAVAAPTANAATLGATSIVANWSQAPGAVAYRLDVSTDNLFGSFLPGYQDLLVSGGATVSQSVTGLSVGTTYYYRVRAIGTNTSSGNSNVITAVTLTPIVSTATGGDWAVGGSWVGGIAPTAASDVQIVSGATITISSSITRNAGTTTLVDLGGTLAATSAFVTNGNVNINGTFRIGGTLNGGGSPVATGTGTWTYSQTTGTLLFNSNATYNLDAGANIFWPSAAGSRPFNVTLQAVNNGNSIQMNAGISRTVDGTFRVAGSAVNTAQLFVNGGGTYTVNGTLQLDLGGLYGNQVVTFGAASTLKLNTGTSFTISSSIWNSGGTVGVVGLARPANVQVSGNTTLTLPNNTFNCAGNLTIDNGSTLNGPSASSLTVNGNVNINGTLTLGASSGGDIIVNGNWTRANAGATFTPNGRAVWFSGGAAQTITISGGGTEVFNYLLVNNSSGNLSLGTSTDVAVNGITGDPLQLLNAGALNLNGRTLYLSGGNGGNIKTSGGARSITGSGTLSIQGNKFVTSASGGSLSTGANVLVDLTAGLDCGSGLTTINGTLQISAGGFVTVNAPIYGSGSLLKYNSATTPYVRGIEWASASGAGYPYNVQIANATTVDPGGTLRTAVVLNVANNLTIDANSALYMDYSAHNMTVPLIINNELVLNGSLAASGAVGGDIVIKGNWTRTGTFTPNSRAVFFQGSNAQVMTGPTGFDYVLIDKTGGSFTLANNMTVNQSLTFTGTNTVNLTTGANRVNISSTGSVVRTGSAYINGNEQRNIATGTNVSRTFDIGDASNYTPVTLDFASVSIAGDVIGFVSTPDQGQLGSSLLNPAKSVNRYWTLTNTGTSFTTYDATFTYVGGDLDGGSSAANLKVAKYDGTWSYPALGTITGTSAQGTGITSFSEFALAECLTPTVVITNPAAVCVPGTIDLTAAAVTLGSDAGLTFTYWEDAGASTNPISNLAAAAISVANTYYIKGTNAAGCFDVKPVVVTFNAKPTGAISGDNTICVGNSTNLSIAVTGTGPWSGTLSDIGATPFSGSSSPITVSVSPGSSFNYTIATLSDALCTAGVADKTGNANITVNSFPTPTITANGPTTFCEGGLLTLTASAGVSYLWLPNGETTQTIAVVSSDSYSVEVTGANTCSSTSVPTVVSVTPATLTPFNVTAAASYLYGFENATPPALFCGMVIGDENNPVDLEQWHTSTLAPNSGTKHMVIDANADGTTAKDDWFYTAPVNLQAGKMYRILFNYRGSNAAKTEQLEVYSGLSPDAATMLFGAAMYSNNNIQNVAYILDSASNFIPAFSATYYFGFHANSAANQASLYIDDIKVKEVTVTAINPAYCTTIPSMYDQIFVQPIPGASNYRFKIVGTGAQSTYNFEHYRNNSNPDYRLKWAPGVIYGYTYNVQVAYYKNGIWSPYGPTCPVSLGAFPAIKLRNNPATVAGPCDYVISDLNDRILTDSLSGANDYMYKIVEDVPGGAYDYDHTWQRQSGNLDFRLVWAYQSSPLIDRVRFGYSYDVQTRALVGKTGVAFGSRPGEWGPYGATCKLDLSATSPTTSLTNCSITLSSLNDQIFTTPVTGATNYEYEFTAPGYTAVVYRGSGNNDYRLIWIPTTPSVPGGARYATTYTVRVKAYVGGVWLSYGAPCTVTTPAAPTTSISTVGFCGSTLSPGQFSSIINCTAVPGASLYSYRITNVGGVAYSKVIYNYNANTSFSLSRTLVCCGQQNLLPNATYTIEVAYYAGVWSAYGPACTFTTGATVPRYSPFASEGVEAAEGALNLSVYPNPATINEQYSLELQGITAANEKVQVAIYNMIGDRVYRADIITKEEATLTIKPEMQLAAGVYMAEAQLNGTIYRVKFVVK
ncbi:MAG: T9SS type A sorting domain-containing protein [Bacteroidetes bacterium]|nr:T9SS type A sorting domain-containing protein [Bacteroidota bacterium]